MEIPIDVRIVCATHQQPEDLIKAQRFREDLYYRLNEVLHQSAAAAAPAG